MSYAVILRNNSILSCARAHSGFELHSSHEASGLEQAATKLRQLTRRSHDSHSKGGALKGVVTQIALHRLASLSNCGAQIEIGNWWLPAIGGRPQLVAARNWWLPAT